MRTVNSVRIFFLFFIGVKVKDNPIVGATISFFEKNADKIQDKDPKEIFDSIRKSMKAKK